MNIVDILSRSTLNGRSYIAVNIFAYLLMLQFKLISNVLVEPYFNPKNISLYLSSYEYVTTVSTVVSFLLKWFGRNDVS